MIIIPPYLQPGNTIAITCPAGYMEAEKTTACIQTLQQWGYQVITGKMVGSDSTNYFSGSDDQRAEELQAMLDDRKIHAILFGRGGYGMSRIVDRLHFKKFSKHPKWLIGYSDITVLHSHLLNKYQVASMHAPMAGAFNDIANATEYIKSLQDAVSGKKASYTCDGYELNRKGDVSGILTGGNLTLLANITGTASDFDTKNKILFIEDTGEYLYGIDRMLYQLKRSGKFDKLAGLVVGGFNDVKDTDRPFGKTLEQLIREVVDDYDFPVCFHFPVSHTNKNVALKSGGRYRLKVTSKKTFLKEV